MKKKKQRKKKRKIFFLILLFLVLILIALFIGYNKDKITGIFKTKPAEKFNIPVFDWELKQINEDQAKYTSDKGDVIITIKTLSLDDIIQEIKKEFSLDNWNSDNNYFATTNKVYWITLGNKLIYFNVNPIPPGILSPYLSKYPPNPGIVNIIFPPAPAIAHCGNKVIEENLGENCEPPEYMEMFGGKKHYVCKTKYADFYDIKCSKKTCRCVFPETEEDFLTTKPKTPIWLPLPFCGDGVVTPPEQCEINAQCPPAWTCIGCICAAPIPGPPKCGDATLQAGEQCEWTPALIPFLLIPCPPGFTCQLPGNLNECKCLTEVKPEEEEMPIPEPEKEKEIEIELEKMKLCGTADPLCWPIGSPCEEGGICNEYCECETIEDITVLTDIQTGFIE